MAVVSKNREVAGVDYVRLAKFTFETGGRRKGLTFVEYVCARPWARFLLKVIIYNSHNYPVSIDAILRQLGTWADKYCVI